jgi:S-DNA-T family DNA segregation ATPase FtsK/SpoIIIE
VGHRGDLIGLLLVAVGLVDARGTYGDLGGPVGRAVADALGVTVGPLRFVMPIVLLVLGALCIRGVDARPKADATEHGAIDVGDDPTAVIDGREAVDPRIVAVRRGLGTTVVVLVVLGLLDLWRGHPGFSASRDELVHAGGFIGVAVGAPLRAVLAPAGATVLLVLLGLAGLVLVTGIPIARAAGATADGIRPAGSAFRQAFGSLFRLEQTGAPTGVDGGPEAVEVVDFNDALPEPARESEPDGAAAVEPTHVVPGQPYDQDVDRTDEHARPTIGAAVPSPTAEAGSGPKGQLQIDLGPAVQRTAWKLPPMKLLNRSGAQQVDKAAIKETGQTLEHALAEHGVETRLVGMTIGPTVTRYELELGPGVKVSRLTSLHKDIAYAMATPDVRILAPIPGRQAIGVEVPNTRKQLVAVGDILASAEAKSASHPLEVAVGRDIAGKAVMANLATMPHVLIAGATGAGKSSCINTLMTSLLMRSTPDQVRLILVDPKRVELGQYNGLPHLLTEVVTSPKKAANALAWAVREMEHRYDLLSEVGVRDVTGYNAAYDRGDLQAAPGTDRTYERLPFILVVVDELNDLMMVAARDVEESITRIAQMARAVGIHLIIATQRPSVNVITGVIKANIPARWAFAVSSLADSRVILDQPGAEKLLGKGDMLLLGPASSIARRIQGSWVTEEEVRSIVAHWKRQSPEVAYDDTVQGTDDTPGVAGRAGTGGGGTGGDDDDELLAQAMELIVRSQLGSTSMLQRKLRVGFARAGRLMDLLEQQGVVGPSEGSKARAVLMTVEELEGGPGAGHGPLGHDEATEPLDAPF